MFSIQGEEISHFLFAMGCLLALAHVLGYLAERFFIPRVIGEVSAGLVLGPTLLGIFSRQCFIGCFWVLRVRISYLDFSINLDYLCLCSTQDLNFRPISAKRT